MTAGDRWLDHQCDRPDNSKSAHGDRWLCHCGSIWEVVKLPALLSGVMNGWSRVRKGHAGSPAICPCPECRKCRDD